MMQGDNKPKKMKTKKYNHMMDFVFSFDSDNENPYETSARIIRIAIFKSLASLSDDELINEAIGNPETEENKNE